MKRLTRYTNFNDLKSHKNREGRSSNNDVTDAAVLKEFFVTLKNSVITQKNDSRLKTINGK
jgi:hypothetical protein